MITCCSTSSKIKHGKSLPPGQTHGVFIGVFLWHKLFFLFVFFFLFFFSPPHEGYRVSHSINQYAVRWERFNYPKIFKAFFMLLFLFYCPKTNYTSPTTPSKGMCLCSHRPDIFIQCDKQCLIQLVLSFKTTLVYFQQ